MEAAVRRRFGVSAEAGRGVQAAGGGLARTSGVDAGLLQPSSETESRGGRSECAGREGARWFGLTEAHLRQGVWVGDLVAWERDASILPCRDEDFRHFVGSSGPVGDCRWPDPRN